MCVRYSLAPIPQSLKQRRRMPLDEVHVAADGFVEELDVAIARMRARHGGDGRGEVLIEGEDHK